MRVLVIAYGYPDATSPQTGHYVLRQIQGMERLGWQARVIRFVPWRPPIGQRWRRSLALPDRYTYEGIDVDVMRVMLLPGFGLMQFLGIQTRSFVKNVASVFRPNLIQAHQLIPSGLLAIDLGYPSVVTAHGSDTYNYPHRNPTFKKAAERVATSATQVVAVSGFIADKASLLGAQNVKVVFNGADPSVFFDRGRSDARNQLKLTSTRKLLLYAGYLGEAKGIFDLVKAVAQLGELRPLLLIAGAGPDQHKLRELLMQLKVEHVFFGRVLQDRLALLISAADAVVLPSHNEGLPLIICETMLAGRAMIASAVGGIPEILRDHQTGLLVRAHDVEGLGRAILEVLTDEPLRQSIEIEAHDFAVHNLTWNANAIAYDKIYRSIIAKSEPDYFVGPSVQS